MIGDVVITVSGGPQSACPTIFATGKGEDKDNPAQVDGNVSITLHGSRANVYTLDKFGEVTSDHAVTIILDDTDELSGAVRVIPSWASTFITMRKTPPPVQKRRQRHRQRRLHLYRNPRVP